MRQFITSISLILLLGAAVTARAGVVLIGNQIEGISNPGFEDGNLNPWFEDRAFTPAATWAVLTDPALANSGNSSAMVDGNNELRQDFDEFAEEVNTAAGPVEIIEFSFFVRTPDLAEQPVFVTIFYENDPAQEEQLATSGTDWEQIDLLSILNSDDLVTGVSVFGNDAFPPDGIVTRTFVDDFSLVGLVIPEPGSSALVILGVAGLLLRRRRRA